MSPSEQIEIVAMEMADGDPGYFCLGHVSRQAFLDRVNGEFDEGFLIEHVRHVFHTSTQPVGKPSKPNSFGEGDNYWWLCEADDEGAAPVTFVRT
jgi:hypothetical protein